ncbi:hypothetical protein RND81_03G022800 [Saponaria officinalis]|uniref:BHLH domain-containing protein n=1 Tax=Saponaria officinalis TaxID=3572 RepID=A0AAW1M208_SAPOF
MEMGAFIDGDWDSLCKMLTFEESQILDGSIFENQNSLVSQDSFLTDLRINNFSDNTWSKMAGYETSHLDLSPCSHFAFPPEHESFLLRNNDAKLAWPFSIDDLINELEIGDDSQSAYLGSLMRPEIELKRKHVADSGAMIKPKKKARISKNIGNKNVQEAEDVGHSQSSTHCGSNASEKSVDESNVFQETSDGENSALKDTVDVTLKGKKRASRGEATDPQSLYARRRRQRINERLRILQNLVPNGAKVDISTMLEEAVHYVKFLQLQIKV